MESIQKQNVPFYIKSCSERIDSLTGVKAASLGRLTPLLMGEMISEALLLLHGGK
jgi:hypothetical protein